VPPEISASSAAVLEGCIVCRQAGRDSVVQLKEEPAAAACIAAAAGLASSPKFNANSIDFMPLAFRTH
jgi:hypothetical protein